MYEKMRECWVVNSDVVSHMQGVTKRCRLSLLTNSALAIRVQMREEGGVAVSQPMSTAVLITWHRAQINFGDLPPYLAYAHMWLCTRSVPNFLLTKNASRPRWGGVSLTWRPCSPSSFCSGWRWPPSPPPSTSSPSRRRRCLRSENKYLFSYSKLLILPRHWNFFKEYSWGSYHRVDRVLGIFSNRPNWDPHPVPHRRVCPSPFGSVGGGTHSLAGEG